MTAISPIGTLSKVGGANPITAALRNVFEVEGVTAPHTGKPFTEAMLLGVGGGLGAGYILWEFKKHDIANVVMGFRNRWNYPVDFIQNTCERLGAAVSVQESGGVKNAVRYLDDALAAGKTPIISLDKASLPYHGLPESMKGYGVHQIVVLGKTDDDLIVADLADAPWRIAADVVTAARGVIGSDKYRVITITPPSTIDLPAAIRAGLADQVEHLGRSSESFSLPVLKKWSKMLTDRKNAKGWHRVFAERNGLIDALRSVYEGIRLDETEGAGLRHLYADFLDEAAGVIDQPVLEDTAALYRQAGAAWIAFANAALPDSSALLKQVKDQLDGRYRAFNGNQADAPRQANERLTAIHDAANAAFPLNDGEIEALFSEMQTRLDAVYDAEVAALESLKQVAA